MGALASKGITKNDVNAQAVGPAAVASLVVAGTVDACACTPDWEINVKDGVKDVVSLPTKDYFQSMSQAILTSDKMIAERPDMVRAIVKATLRGMKFVMDDPNKAALAYVEASPSFKGKEELMKQILANYTERTYKGQSDARRDGPAAAGQPAEILQEPGLHRGRAAGRPALQQRLHQIDWRIDRRSGAMADDRQRIDDLVNRGLLDQWYAVAKSVQVKPGKPHAVKALGRNLVLWRDAAGASSAWKTIARIAAPGSRAARCWATTSPAATTA